MQLDAAQHRIVKSKPVPISLLKGSSSTGKTTTAVYRTLYLKNNYCLYDDDKILIIAKDSTNRDYIRELYNRLEDDTKNDYITLFSNAVDRVEIYTLGDIINRYYFEYTNTNKNWFKIIHEQAERLEIVGECAEELRTKHGKAKIINENYLKFLKEELEWIKACGYNSLEAYQEADRIGRKSKKGEGPARLLKNSKDREIIFELLGMYNSKLQERGILDCEDISHIALMQAKHTFMDKFTHILVDEGQELSKTQIDFIRALSSNKSYSSLMFIIDKIDNNNSKAWISKGRKQAALKFNASIKNYLLKKTYEADLSRGEAAVMEAPKITELEAKVDIEENSMDSFEYFDLRHHRKYDFKRDSSRITDVVLEEESLALDELKQVPVYSDIAAGEPIMMSSELEAEFYLPGYWVKGVKDLFILKVKGDSMIGANIFDGDQVVIRQQHTAQNGDIVAVDLEGSATLKRLSLKKNVPILMPENDKYDPIHLHDREATILGIAMGVIKRVSN
ncbi:transcriptional repressor LexA [Clostridium swellfunianum]|uniref:transcriptional repressor LexA n=1 Tax=Clostridium swellfunianum TaxID=1367462 RepID=UPI00202E3DC2|nr:transcriptional repressor LexA [Clostridium swellfunianum]MCM0648275.1 transcriptional repressor LexA [Clostridium swellfunianum]